MRSSACCGFEALSEALIGVRVIGRGEHIKSVMPMRKSQQLAGLCAPFIGLGGIFTAIFIHRSWWSLTENAISDLGKVGLPYNWVMNVPIVVAAVLGIYYALGLFKEAKHPTIKLGIGIFILGLVFLAGIGIFPEGTSPHYYVSWGFFITASLGIMVAGIGLYLEGEKQLGIITVIIFVLSWIFGFWAMRVFNGVAISEFIGIFGIVIWHYMVLAKILKKGKKA
ncbi:DUF998 domain-containing protein [Thermococcus paralvinellae]|uniref:DUF998 domain-containing protein n=1 Tax=Thermococcus paralvinellae TaxID=582419 RepID=W0I348_9EURY|nr:DUF998 domain-containing protein [Thermococcus paralvinellae]AHF80471.1 Hypothetical protein TES1_1087 [Thermococcus paralvinellae]